MSRLKSRRLPSSHLLRPASLLSHKPPPVTLNSTYLIGKSQGLIQKYTGGREAVKPMRLPKVSNNAAQMDKMPVSPYFGKENSSPVKADLEEICLPYELEDGNRPKPLHKIDPNTRKTPIKRPIKPPVNLRKGAFSRKFINPKEINDISTVSELNTSLDHSVVEIPSVNNSFMESIRRSSRSPSPVVTARHSRMQQLSRRFQLNKSSLSHHYHSAEPHVHLPLYSFLHDLEEVLHLPN